MQKTIPFQPQMFDYRVRWRTHGVVAGMHASKTIGGHADFKGFDRFLSMPDPKRIDVRRSLRMVPRTLMVRAYHERSAIPVFAVVDSSTSMRFIGQVDKWRLVAEMASSIAWSATQHGDPFSLLVSDDALRQDLCLFNQRRRGVAQEVYEKLLQATMPKQVANQGFSSLSKHLPRKKALVFYISDFHTKAETLASHLQTMAPHDVVPIVLWDSAEYKDVPAWGWARMRDSETGCDAPLFIRPALLKKMNAHYARHRDELVYLCAKHRVRKPFFVENVFNPTRLSQHLLEGS